VEYTSGMKALLMVILTRTIYMDNPSNQIMVTIIAFLILGSLLFYLIKPKRY
jgi:hypothetical protein